jgi:transcriptional regulator with XRE-family HTH domain
MQKTRQRQLTVEDKKLAKRIKEIRESKDITQEALSLKIGANPNYIVFVETGRRGLSLTMVYRLSKALNVTLKELFSFK